MRLSYISILIIATVFIGVDYVDGHKKGNHGDKKILKLIIQKLEFLTTKMLEIESKVQCLSCSPAESTVEPSGPSHPPPSPPTPPSPPSPPPPPPTTTTGSCEPVQLLPANVTTPPTSESNGN